MASPKKKKQSSKTTQSSHKQAQSSPKSSHKQTKASPRTSHKKTHSSPNPATLRVFRAIKKTRSMNGLRPKSVITPSTSSPVSVKKNPISENLKKQMSKKRKKLDTDTPPAKNEGIKLLKRGCVTMHRIVRRKINGQKPTVLFNEKGEPYGDVASEMQSYIGVLARTKAPIWHDTWKQVPEAIKTKIWECVQVKLNL